MNSGSANASKNIFKISNFGPESLSTRPGATKPGEGITFKFGIQNQFCGTI